MTKYKTPGVYVQEIAVFPPSITEVETAIPAFIGYTEFAFKKLEDDLLLIPTKISSLAAYEASFGGPPEDPIEITVEIDKSGAISRASMKEPTLCHILYYSVKMYFENGGGSCYIISAGTYQSPHSIVWCSDMKSRQNLMNGLSEGLDRLAQVDEPTLIVIPEAVKLLAADYSTLVQAVLAQCSKLGDRFAIFDIYNGDSVLDSYALTTIRGYFGTDFLKYGSAYYPFIKTTLNFYQKEDESNVTVNFPGGFGTLDTLRNSNAAIYNLAKAELKNHFVVLPPSGAIAGAFAATDRQRGVWKAPANMSLTGVISPAINLDKIHQDILTIDTNTGKSINVIRAISGKGTAVYGARTLAGNDNEWRYIPVRRFFNMVEESIKKSSNWAVFEQNTAGTWTKVCAMIENYLIRKWHDGALTGATANEAFFVRCGLGVTMTAQDVLDGNMIIEIGMAVVRPAEFIILTLSQSVNAN